MMILWQNQFGRSKPFQLFEKDGVTPRPLVGLTLIWRFKSVNDPTILLSLPCTITDATNGLFTATPDTTVTTNVDEYECQIEVSEAGVLLEPSEFFNVAVLRTSAVAG